MWFPISHFHPSRPRKCMVRSTPNQYPPVMNFLYFTLKDRKSLKSLRLEYGQLGLKFVLRMFEGQIDRRGGGENIYRLIYSISTLFLSVIKLLIESMWNKTRKD